MEIIKEYRSILKKEKKYLIFLICCVAVGFFVGIILHKALEKQVLVGNIANFYINALSIDGSFLSISFANLFLDLVLVLLFYLFSLSVYLYPFKAFVLFYFSYVLGGALAVFISFLGISGLFLFLFSVLLHSVIACFSLVLFSVLCYHQDKTCKSKTKIKEIKFKLLIVSFVIMLAGVLISSLFLIAFLRPINFVI